MYHTLERHLLASDSLFLRRFINPHPSHIWLSSLNNRHTLSSISSDNLRRTTFFHCLISLIVALDTKTLEEYFTNTNTTFRA